ncbi:MAG: dephospho-CoA kinase [Thiomicrorhabdus sp.]|nr:dephospho-CoA kinase [Thiomicrorhabdus sp.]
MTKVIGLTGGIGAGKSTVTDFLAKQNIPVIDTDQIAREIVQPNSPALKQVVNYFGKHCLNPDGTLNRAKLREIIFNDAEAKQALEAILHPLIQKKALQKITQYKKTAPAFIIVAIPLLIETIKKQTTRPGYIDEIWVVDCPVEQQIKRAVQRDGSERTLIEKIIAQQASREERLQHADYIIDNTQSIEQLQKSLQQKLGF